MAKGKGSAFEREISKQLSLWWTEGERDDVFWRTNASGARFTARRKQGKSTEGQGGDITCTDPIGRALTDLFSIELKTGYSSKSKTKKGLRFTNWCVSDVIDSKGNLPIFLRMWEQCIRDAEATNRKPMLIFRRTGRTACVCLMKEDVNRIEEYFGGHIGPTLVLSLKRYAYRLVVMDFKEFLNWTNKPTMVFNQLSEKRRGTAFNRASLL